MPRTRLVLAIATAAVTAGLALCATSGNAATPAAPGEESLQVVAASQRYAPAHQTVDVPVVIASRDTGMFCKPVDVRLTYWFSRASHGTVETVASSTTPVQAMVLRIPAVRVRPGLLHYRVAASQRCGLLEPSYERAGLAPRVGAFLVRVVAGA